MSLSVYVHVPFCRTRCRYCAFYSGEPLGALAPYPSWIAAEARRRASRAQPSSRGITTLYLGGGTPSLLGAPGVASILRAIHGAWGFSDAEITLEVNPAEDLDFAGLRAAGVTRLSLGIQCLDDALLALLGRRHTARQALAALEGAARAGFDSISVDFLLGLPALPPGVFARWIGMVRDAGAHHVSTYSLEVHPGTPLAIAVADRSLALPSPPDEEAQWEAADGALSSCGFTPYEVSNYSVPGHECRHNLAYWERSPYVGLGPGAHAFDPAEGAWGTRSWNDPGLTAYVNSLTSGRLPPGGHEHLTPQESLLEGLFLALRRPVPFDFRHLADSHGAPPERLLRRVEQAEALGLLLREEARGSPLWCPTRQGLRRADGMAVWLSEATTCRQTRGQTP